MKWFNSFFQSTHSKEDETVVRLMLKLHSGDALATEEQEILDLQFHKNPKDYYNLSVLCENFIRDLRLQNATSQPEQKLEKKKPTSAQSRSSSANYGLLQKLALGLAVLPAVAASSKTQEDSASDALVQSGGNIATSDAQIFSNPSHQLSPNSLPPLSPALKSATETVFREIAGNFQDEELRSANSGNIVAALNVGRYYATGTKGFPKNKDAALRFFQTAAAADHVAQDSILHLAVDYIKGQKVEKDEKFGIQILEILSNLNNPNACHDLGYYYMHGSIVPKDIARSIEYYKKAVSLGNVHSKHDLGMFYLNEDNHHSQSLETILLLRQEGILLLEQAIDAGHAKAINGLLIHYDTHDHTKRIKLLHHLVEDLNHYYSESEKLYTRELGDYYMSEHYISKDEDKAINYYKRSAELGDNHSKYKLTRHYVSKINTTQDIAEKITFLKQAADLGYPSSMYELGNYYMKGNDVPKDEARAAQYYKQAADLDHPNAIYELGNCYMRGIGVAQDPIQADRLFQIHYVMKINGAKDIAEKIRFLEQAADSGHHNSMHELGNYYMKGIGIAQNPMKAAKLFQMAANADQNLHKKSQDSFDELLKSQSQSGNISAIWGITRDYASKNPLNADVLSFDDLNDFDIVALNKTDDALLRRLGQEKKEDEELKTDILTGLMIAASVPLAIGYAYLSRKNQERLINKLDLEKLIPLFESMLTSDEDEYLENIAFDRISKLAAEQNNLEALKFVFRKITNARTAIDFSGCNNLTALPLPLPARLKSINLSGCTNLILTEELLENLLTLNEAGCDITPSIPTLLENRLNSAVTKFNSRFDDQHQHVNFLQTKSIFHRFLSEDLGQRESFSKIAKQAGYVIDSLEKDPQHLEWMEEISANLGEGCVNQPINGFSEITAWMKVAKAESLSAKLEAAKQVITLIELREFALFKTNSRTKTDKEIAAAKKATEDARKAWEDAIAEGIEEKIEQAATTLKTAEEIEAATRAKQELKIGNKGFQVKIENGLGIRSGVEVEAGNLLYIKLHNELLAAGKIAQEWTGVPEQIPYVETVVRWVTDSKVDEALRYIESEEFLENNRALTAKIFEGPYALRFATIAFPQETAEIKKQFADEKALIELIQEKRDGDGESSLSATSGKSDEEIKNEILGTDPAYKAKIKKIEELVQKSPRELMEYYTFLSEKIEAEMIINKAKQLMAQELPDVVDEHYGAAAALPPSDSDEELSSASAAAASQPKLRLRRPGVTPLANSTQNQLPGQ